MQQCRQALRPYVPWVCVGGVYTVQAAYLGGLLRKAVISELELTTKHGLTFLPRPHNSFTPLRDGRSLLMGPEQLTIREIAKFSPKDAEAYPKFEAQLRRFARVLDGVVDSAPIDPAATAPTGSLWSRRAQLSEQVAMLVKTGGRLGGLGRETAAFVELLTAPASRILDQWFESDVLKATLATDAIIGAMESVHTQGSGYVHALVENTRCFGRDATREECTHQEGPRWQRTGAHAHTRPR